MRFYAIWSRMVLESGAVLVVCALAIVAALAVSSIAYYGLWVLAIGTFLLAVYYTVKMM